MKKKLIALVLVAALICVSVVTGTMAYLTDSEEATNVFAVGNVDVAMSTGASVHKYNAEGAEIDGKVTEDGETVKFNKIIPTNYMKRQMTITNTGDVPAYVRVLVVMNNVEAGYKAFKNYSDAELTSMYETVYDGWNVSVNTTTKKIDGISDSTGILHVDYAENLDGVLEEVSDWNNADYGTLIGSDERVFAYYLKLDAKASKTLFNGLMAPGEFDNEQIKMFEGLKVEVYADAIQADGFDYLIDASGNQYLGENDTPADAEEIAKRAFDALDDAHPMSKMRVVVDLPAAGVTSTNDTVVINEKFEFLNSYLGNGGIEAADVVPFALSLSTTETNISVEEYKDWNVDFVVSVDRDVDNDGTLGANAEAIEIDDLSWFNGVDFNLYNDKIVLIGAYGGFSAPCSMPGEIEADHEYRVMKELFMGGAYYPFTYEDVVQSVGTFDCGVAFNIGGAIVEATGGSKGENSDPDHEIDGITVTVELRIYETDDIGEETGKSFVIHKDSYTFNYSEHEGTYPPVE